MAIVLTIFLFLLGAILMVVAGVLLAVRQAVTQFLAGFPPDDARDDGEFRSEGETLARDDRASS